MNVTSNRRREREEYDPLDPAKQHAPVAAGALVSSYLDERMLVGATDASRALVTWRRIAGRRAAKHTVAVWLNRPKSGDGLPEMVVYLDGNALMADLTTNAELYVERLAYAGLPVARVRFRLSRKAGQTVESGVPGAIAASARKDSFGARPPRPELTAAEHARVKASCAQLPESLRTSAEIALENSIRKEKGAKEAR